MAKKLLQGVLTDHPDKWVQKLNASHYFDRRLFRQDIAISLAHAKMLLNIGILTKGEYQTLVKGLEAVRTTIEGKKLKWRDELEDVHMHIEASLTRKIGKIGKKLHIGRSRNDQSVTGTRLYLRDSIDLICAHMLSLRQVLVNQAEKTAGLLMPGFTHLQPAQPITCGHHLMAWYEMLSRDHERMLDCRKRVNQMPLGSAALAGTSIRVDRPFLAKELGFTKPMANSIDAVSSRDFIIEFLAVAAICMQHLSRWSEEIILWSTAQFGFIQLPDKLSTGSSIMPQKKNPDLVELVRGKSGRVFGNLVALLCLMKAQPLAYNKDNQEDKEPLFDTVQTLVSCLTGCELVIADMKFKPDNMRAALKQGYINATCLADYLTAKNIPFRDAYRISGQLVQLAQQKGMELSQLSLADMQKASSLIEKDVYKYLDYDEIVASYNHLGGSAPKQVKRATALAKKVLPKQAGAG